MEVTEYLFGVKEIDIDAGTPDDSLNEPKADDVEYILSLSSLIYEVALTEG